MRWGRVLVGVLLVGCSRPNPFFALLSDGSSGDVGSAGTTDAGDSTSTGSIVDTSVGSGSSEDEAASTSDPQTSSGTSTGGGAETGAGTEAASSSSGGEGGSSSGSSSGGEPEEAVAYDLWELCPKAAWSSEGEKAFVLQCNLGKTPPPVPWAGRQLEGFEGEAQVVAEWPYPGDQNVVTGFYKGLILDGSSGPRLRTTLVCPGPAACKISGAIWAEVNNQVKAYSEVPMLESGGQVVIDLDLDALNDGVAFDVVMTVKSLSPTPSTRGLWLRPRVVVFP